MPELTIDSKSVSAENGQLDPREPVPPEDQAEQISSGAQITLAQFAAEVSDALKQSAGVGPRVLKPLMDLFQGSSRCEEERGRAIAVHSSLLMDLLGTDNTSVDRSSADKNREEPLPLPAAAEPVPSLPLPVPFIDNSPQGSSAPAQSSVAPAASACEVRSNAVSASPLPINVVIDSAVRAISILKLKLSSVISVARVEDGWRIAMELVERAGVPDTSDVLGVYELRLDGAGNVLAYERTRMRRRCDLSR